MRSRYLSTGDKLAVNFFLCLDCFDFLDIFSSLYTSNAATIEQRSSKIHPDPAIIVAKFPEVEQRCQQFFTFFSVQLLILREDRLCFQARYQAGGALTQNPTDLTLIVYLLVLHDSFLGNRSIHDLRVGPFACLGKVLAYVI